MRSHALLLRVPGGFGGDGSLAHGGQDPCDRVGRCSVARRMDFFLGISAIGGDGRAIHLLVSYFLPDLVRRFVRLPDHFDEAGVS